MTIQKHQPVNIIKATVFRIFTEVLEQTFLHKGFDLSVLTSYSIGGKIYDSLYTGSMNAQYATNTWNKHQLRRWQKPGDITDVPRVEINGAYTTTDRFLINASYFAIKNITLGYSLPKDWMRKAKLEMSVYSVPLITWRYFLI